jgi:hypothetical protein
VGYRPPGATNDLAVLPPLRPPPPKVKEADADAGEEERRRAQARQVAALEQQMRAIEEQQALLRVELSRLKK